LIRVHAVSVNPIDTYVRSGAVAFELPQPFIVGCDAAGVVEAVGEGVHHFAVGDRVWCTNQGLLGRQGTFAEKIAVAEDWCFPLPDQVSFEDAAACALVAVTAHLGLYREAMLEAGETMLVIGGSGGVGSMVVQMGQATGARVIATAGSDEKCKRVRSLGADVVINYKEQSIEEAVRREAPKGVNVFWETRRQPDFEMAVELMAGHGRMILMAGRDARPTFPVGPFYVKECSLHGFVMFKATPVEMRSAADDINHWLVQGKIRANIAKTLPLGRAAEAHRLQEAATLEGGGDLAGKIVLTID
jgi:NADPH2:quinone reductase